MKKIACLFALSLILTAFISREAAGQETFSFYGLEFGSTPAEVRTHFPKLDGNLVEDPGHGMSSLELYFDREDLLMEIRATYPRPDDKLEALGQQRALRERFIAPVRDSFPAISVSIDEYGNRAASTVIFQSTGIREKNIEFHKRQHLKKME